MVYYINHLNVTSSLSEGMFKIFTTRKDDTISEWDKIAKMIQERNQSLLNCQEENENTVAVGSSRMVFE